MKSLIWIGVVSGFFAGGVGSSFAQTEGVNDVGQQKAQKEVLVKYLQARVKAHAKMSAPALLQEAIQDYQSRRKTIENMADVEGQKKADVLKVLDDGLAQLKIDLATETGRELYLLREKRELQEIQTSGWYMFLASLAIVFLVTYREIQASPALYLLLVITVPLDLVTLPFTFIASACTGF